MSLREVAYSGITAIFAIAMVMIVYTFMNDFVTITLSSLAAQTSMPEGLVNNLLLIWTYFPIPFILCIMVWMVYTATGEGSVTY